MTAESPQKPPFQWWPPTRPLMLGLRDISLFVIGAVGLYHETFVVQSSEAQLLAIFGACLGLPFFLRKDAQ